ncbi:hypothetical protein DNI29_04370 [Hymenobacter sediminis]|uniref:hypothetical protein n=1 Tax=Hymenobacter sediminis TaxID=2218621 RepID=UPI000DA66E47|nr:hypothetical protein [Hymenobacter sediminis]RPD50038.1 hypothetical protein DNI29_04370 [Hymenobacter sediminis]
MEQQRIEEIRQRLQAATPGPWFVADGLVMAKYEAGINQKITADYEACPVMPEDAELIAHAPSDIQYLLDQLHHATQEAEGQWDIQKLETQAEVLKLILYECEFEPARATDDEFRKGRLFERELVAKWVKGQIAQVERGLVIARAAAPASKGGEEGGVKE